MAVSRTGLLRASRTFSYGLVPITKCVSFEGSALFLKSYAPFDRKVVPEDKLENAQVVTYQHFTKHENA